MSNKFQPRFKKYHYQEPAKPKVDEKRFRMECLESVGERYMHFPNTGRDECYEYGDECYEYGDEDNPEISGKLPERQAISLRHINNLIKQNNLDEKNVFLTASFSDDYLMVEVVHIRQLSGEELKEEYEEQYAEWEEEQKYKKEQEILRIEQQMKILESQAKRLKGK